jgi:hypothetical protein
MFDAHGRGRESIGGRTRFPEGIVSPTRERALFAKLTDYIVTCEDGGKGTTGRRRQSKEIIAPTLNQAIGRDATGATSVQGGGN